MPKRMSAFRLGKETTRRLERLAEHWRLDKTAALEQAIEAAWSGIGDYPPLNVPPAVDKQGTVELDVMQAPTESEKPDPQKSFTSLRREVPKPGWKKDDK